MDYGAYGSYPAYLSRRRGRRGLRLGKRSYGRSRRYPRPSPLNPYTYRKTRVGRLTKTALTSVKCTYTDRIYLNSASAYLFAATNAAYINLATMLAQSPEFVSRVAQYSYYMINGMQVKCTRKWIDPIEYGVDGTSPGFTVGTYSRGLSMVSANFYPNLNTSTVGQPVEDADSSWKISPYITSVQSHYQPFPKNFTTGSNSNGLGVWNAGNNYTNISGELAIYANAAENAAASDQAVITIWDVEVNFYVAFCNNTGA